MILLGERPLPPLCPFCHRPHNVQEPCDPDQVEVPALV